MKDGAGASRPQGQPRAHSKAGGSLGLGYPEPPLPRCSALSQPPSNRPISSIMRLTCSYWPLVNQCQWCVGCGEPANRINRDAQQNTAGERPEAQRTFQL